LVVKELFSGFEFLFLMFIRDVRPVLIFVNFLMLSGRFFLGGIFFYFVCEVCSYIFFIFYRMEYEECFKVKVSKDHG